MDLLAVFIFFGIYFCAFGKTNGVSNNKDKRLVFKDVNVTVDRNYGLGSAEVVYQNGYGVVDFNFTVTKIVPAERSFVQYRVHRKMLSNKFLPAIISKKSNLCKVLANPKIDPYLYKLTENLSRFTALFKNCPMRMGTYLAKGYLIDLSYFPSFIPLGEYVLSYSGYDYNKKKYTKFIDMYFNSEIIPKA